MIVSEELKRQIQVLNLQLRTASQEQRKSGQECDRTKKEAERLWAEMNFRERYLGCWFGGDRDKVKKYKNNKSLSEEFNVKSEKFKAETELLDNLIDKTIDKDLRGHDIDYLVLTKPYDAADEMNASLQDYLSEIDDALSEIDDAQCVETADLFSSNKGIAVWSYFENKEASEAVEKVKKCTPAFQAALDNYNRTLKSSNAPDIENPIGDGVDTLFDLAFDGFDFMSIFSLEKLENAEESMRDLRAKVKEVEKVVDKNLRETDRARRSYVMRVRAACLS